MIVVSQDIQFHYIVLVGVLFWNVVSQHFTHLTLRESYDTSTIDAMLLQQHYFFEEFGFGWLGQLAGSGRASISFCETVRKMAEANNQ